MRQNLKTELCCLKPPSARGRSWKGQGRSLTLNKDREGKKICWTDSPRVGPDLWAKDEDSEVRPALHPHPTYRHPQVSGSSPPPPELQCPLEPRTGHHQELAVKIIGNSENLNFKIHFNSTNLGHLPCCEPLPWVTQSSLLRGFQG